jgi:hypothetical protein
MSDGAIVHDEQTRIGEVPQRARNGGVVTLKTDEEAQLEGISELMKVLPERPAPARKRSTKNIPKSRKKHVASGRKSRRKA